MALKKQIIEKNGVVTEYHKIVNILVNPKTIHYIKEPQTTEGKPVWYRQVRKEGYEIKVTLASYVNIDLRNKSADFVVLKNNFVFIIDAQQMEENSIFETAYTELKTLSQFAGAEDC